MDSTALSSPLSPSVAPQLLPSAEGTALTSAPSSMAESSESDLIELSPQRCSTEQDNTQSESPIKNQPKGFWKIFFSTFLTIFLAELGDKTQVTTLLLSAQSRSPWIVFAGAGLALATTSLIGVLLGRWLARHISPNTLNRASGVVLLLIAAGLFWDILKLKF